MPRPSATGATERERANRPYNGLKMTSWRPLIGHAAVCLRTGRFETRSHHIPLLSVGLKGTSKNWLRYSQFVSLSFRPHSTPLRAGCGRNLSLFEKNSYFLSQERFLAVLRNDSF